jgi:hypothetical protein
MLYVAEVQVKFAPNTDFLIHYAYIIFHAFDSIWSINLIQFMLLLVCVEIICSNSSIYL